MNEHQTLKNQESPHQLFKEQVPVLIELLLRVATDAH